MSDKSRPEIKVLRDRADRISIPSSAAGLARSHRIIRIERQREIQFLKLCCQIKIEDFKNDRAESQRLDRKSKREFKKTLAAS